MVSMPAPLAIMRINIAKTPEFVSLEVRRTGVDARQFSAVDSRSHVVECAFKSPLRARGGAFHDACFLGFDVRGLSSALRRWLILISAVAHQRQAVALLTPSLRQIGFHRMPSARSHTMRASSGSSQNSQAKHSSMRSMDCGVAKKLS